MSFLLQLRLFLLLAFASCFATEAYSQLKLNGAVYSSDSSELKDCLLKIRKAYNSSFLHFQSLSCTHKFSFLINHLSKNDTLEIIISKQGFNTELKKINFKPGDSSISFNFFLTPTGKELKEIIIKPSYWKKGDTTFFAVDSFKTGEERKLKDIISKLPGFTYTDETLRYKGKAVTKIFIENEDLFAERTNLLLESVPIYTLSQVEAIENQPVNRLLKGLTNDVETIVNLRLKKEKMKFAFGDADIGITSNNRYHVNPTLFLLANKFNLAFIGFNNNLGTNLNSLYKNPATGSAASNLILQPSNFKSINNFNKSRYVSNRLLNNQFTTSYHFGKNIKAKSEFIFAGEKMKQESYSKLTLLDSLLLFQRTETNSFHNLEALAHFKQNFSFNFSKTKNLAVKYQYLFNRNINNNDYIIKDNSEDSVLVRQKNKCRLHLLNLDYTHRVSESKAKATAFSISYQTLAAARNISARFIPLFYQISDPLLTENFQTNSISFLESKLITNFIRKKEERILNYSFNYSFSFLNLKNKGNLFSKSFPDSILALTNFSGIGIYYAHNLSFVTARNYSVKKNKLSWAIEPGLSYLFREETNNQENKLIPELGLRGKWERRLAKKIGTSVTFNFGNKAILNEEMPQMLIPQQYNSFQQKNFALTNAPSIGIQITLNKVTNFGHQFFLNYSFQENIKSRISNSAYSQFMNITKTSVVAFPSGTHSVYSDNTFLIEKIRGKIHLIGSFTTSQLLSGERFNLLKIRSNYGNVSFIAESVVAKKYFLYLNNAVSYISLKFPSSFNQRFSKGVYTVKTALNQRINFTKNLSLYVETNFYQFNITSPEKSKMIFIDADIQYKFKNKYSMSLKAENILNEKEYQSVFISGLSQSIFTIPLVPINVLLSFRVEL